MAIKVTYKANLIDARYIYPILILNLLEYLLLLFKENLYDHMDAKTS